jgi:hypothetical protein
LSNYQNCCSENGSNIQIKLATTNVTTAIAATVSTATESACSIVQTISDAAEGVAKHATDSSIEEAVSHSTVTGCWAANVHRNFFANNLWNTAGIGVWNVNADATSYLHRAGVRNAFANCVWNRLGASCWNHFAYGVAVVLSLALRNNRAYFVADVFYALLANHFAGCVANGLLTAFWNHFACCAANSLRAWLADHGAYFVAYGLGVALRNHFAGGVAYSLLTAFWHHSANVVCAFFGTAFSNHLAAGVWNNLGANFAFDTSAVDGSLFAAWDPNALANRARWALYAFNATSTWAPYATARSSVPLPATACAVNFANDTTWNFNSPIFPVTCVDHNSLGVVHRGSDGIGNCSFASFRNRNHNGVVDGTSLGLMNWVHDRVVDNLLMGFLYRLHNRVIDYFFASLPHWLTNGVVDNLLMGFIHWLHNGVVDHFLVRFVNRTAYVVRNLLGASFVHRTIYRVGTCPLFCLIHRLVNRVGDFSIFGRSLVPNTLNLFVFIYRLVLTTCSCNRFRFVNHSSDRSHYCAVRWTIWVLNASTAILVTNRTAIRRESHLGRRGGKHRR